MLTIPPGLDPDVLRAFVMVAEGRSVTASAERLSRTQSAISMQLKKLEEVLGAKLLARGGRGLEPTQQGLWLLERARTLLTLHDEIHAAFRAAPLTGQVRLGSPDDYALQWLPGVLARFAERQPRVEVDVVCVSSEELAVRLEAGALDLAIMTEGHERPGQAGEEIWRGPLRWVGPVNTGLARRDPLPLALAHPGCTWRRLALQALGLAGRQARVTYNAATQTGCFAVVLAGLALTVSTPTRLPPGLAWLGDGLPTLPDIGISLHQAEGAEAPAVSALAEAIREGFGAGALAAA
jgi:DNA-binding transcriptional LysR family regulator